MKKEEQEREKDTALLLMETLRQLVLKEDINDERYQRILNILSESIQNVLKDHKIPKNEVQYVYNSICRLCFVDKIKFNSEEAEALNNLNKFGQPNGVWDSLSRSNFTGLATWMVR